MAQVESGFDRLAVSSKGACGVMQVMPDTAALYGVSRSRLFDEDVNIQLGLYYLRKMLDLFRDRNLALAAYNCGPGRVIRSGYRIPDIAETRDYVRRANDAARQYRHTGF